MNAATTRELKPHKTFEVQLELLKSRGLAIGNEQCAIAALERQGYYRLSGYFYALRRTRPPGQPGQEDTFVDGASLALVVALAEFDKGLRLLALYALETIEVAVRVTVAHHLGRLDPQAHLNPKFLDGRFTQPGRWGAPSQHAQWVERFEHLCSTSKEEFVEHHRAAYGGQMPIWVSTEVWDFGLLSRFVAGLQFRDRNAVATRCGVADGEILRSWMRSFNFVRNVAAHHARLWNRITPEIPALPALERCRGLEVLHRDGQALRKLFGTLTCMQWMLRTIAPQSPWHGWLKQHMATFPATELLSIHAAGFPHDWQELPVWNP